MAIDPHLAALGVLTVAAGWLMARAGLDKGALELRRPRRNCPACGRRLKARVCETCSAG